MASTGSSPRSRLSRPFPIQTSWRTWKFETAAWLGTTVARFSTGTPERAGRGYSSSRRLLTTTATSCSAM
uniref:Uncharacterized protein n=1 Tax=Steinernema glaseri TaxID=37863 RepID=A0A1I7Z6I7_9BILA